MNKMVKKIKDLKTGEIFHENTEVNVDKEDEKNATDS